MYSKVNRRAFLDQSVSVAGLGVPAPLSANRQERRTAPAATKVVLVKMEDRQKGGAGGITIGERSGPPPTRRIMEEKGIFELAVGMTPKRLMREPHGNRQHMRRMIAEINLGHQPRFIVLDGVEAFVDGGPSEGKRVTANVFVGGTDRIALDAVGVAILKELGSNAAIMDRKIFRQEQIQRAVELGLGIGRPDQIELVTGDEASRAYADKIKARLAQG